jgi:hypothetical protein
MNSLKGVAVVVGLLFAMNALAEGWGGVLKGIKEKLDTSAGQNTKQAKPIAATPDPVQVHPENTPVKVTTETEVQVPIVNAVFDIKGIQLGMSINEVMTLARKELMATDSQAQCTAQQIPANHDWYVMGDQVVACRGYQYFGQPVANMKAFFIGGKLKFLMIGTFYSETDLDHDYPAVSSALAEKYRTQPVLDYGNNRFSDDHNFVVAMKDQEGSELASSGHRRPYMSGVSYKNVSIYMQARDYEQAKATRESELQAAEARARKDEQQLKQRDL